MACCMQNLLRACLCLLMSNGSAAAWSAERDAPPLHDPRRPYTAERTNAVTHDVDFQVIVTPPAGTRLLKVWLPLPLSDFGQEIRRSELSTFPEEVRPQIAGEAVYGNRFAYFEFHEPRGAQIVRHRFQARVWDLHWNVVPEKVAAVASWPGAFEPYLQPQLLADQAGFERLLAEIVPRREGNGRDMLQAMDWIGSKLAYDHVHASLRADAEHALRHRRGHCSDYHGLCATIGRSLGYPTRVTYGLTLFPKSSPSHCKLEVYLPPYGWVSFDLSETQKLIQQIVADKSLEGERKQQLVASARDRMMRGFRENSWLLVTRGTDYELAPRASQPVRVVRTIYAEADGQPLPDPDPANVEKREFAWMTAHRFRADREFSRPFEEISSLEQESARHASGE